MMISTQRHCIVTGMANVAPSGAQT